MVTRIVIAVALVAGCKFDTGNFDDRSCAGEADCRPDQDCIDSLCTQIADCTPGDLGPVILECGPGYQFSCDPAGGCVVKECGAPDQCAIGYLCTAGFCALACTGQDDDGDAICDDVDNCPLVSNRDQLDTDLDLHGDACDPCPFDENDDADGDTVCGDIDNCPVLANMNQLNTDGDMTGDACDSDDDNDGLADASDPASTNPDECGDTDTDTCDDCAVGTDGFGPLSDRDPTNDGLDTDTDGRCDLGDTDDDNDGKLDGVDVCDAGETGWVSNSTTDFDGDGCRDAGEDLDDDNDGVLDAMDPQVRNADVCGDTDVDMCDDCAIGTDNTGPLSDSLPGNDGTDTDMDGLCNTGDPDDDGDTINDGMDSAPLNRFLCRDLDADSCDDCSVTGGPPTAINDGLDTDSDGICNLGDGDDDGDTVGDATDNAPLDRFSCRDGDADLCDDCSQTGGPPSTTSDGMDTDIDGSCNTGDPDDDNDGVNDGADPADINPNVCGRDVDADTCDDCSNGVDGFGPAADFVPADDGLDTDLDGDCNLGDTDDDNDSVLDPMDISPLDRFACRDVDIDMCDDCSVSGGPPNTANDGTDNDLDGACNLGDSDDDNDGRPDATDPNDNNPNICGLDADADTCDDCAVGVDGTGPLPDNIPNNDGPDPDADGICTAGDCAPANNHCTLNCTDVDADGWCIPQDCNDCIDTCTADCTTNSDVDVGGTVVDCVEVFCGSSPTSGSSTCRIATDETMLNNAIGGANTNPGADFILLNASFMVALDLNNFLDTAGATIRQCEGTTVTVNAAADRTLFEFDFGPNHVEGVSLANTANGNIMIRMDSASNTVIDTIIAGYEKNGIYITSGTNTILDTTIRGGTQASGLGVGAITLFGNGASNNQIIGNVLVNNVHDAINLEDSDNTFIDHNTIAFNGGDAIDFAGNNTHSGNCARNNIFASNTGFAVRNNGSVSWNTTTCTTPLTAGRYGNDHHLNTGGLCGGNCNSGSTCSCVPGAANGTNFFEFNINPSFLSTTPSMPTYYCLGTPGASGLINTMDNLGIDVNGNDAGLFNGAAPDGGGRETGSAGCP